MASLTFLLALVAMCSFAAGATRNNYRQQYNYFRQRSPSSYYYNSYSPSTVGFTVVKTVSQTFSADGVVTFDKVVTNVGKAFQASDSKVKIPTTGLYFFSFSVRTNSSDGETVDLIKNGERVVTAMGLTAASGAVLFVRKGDKVSVNAREDSLIVNTVALAKTSFSGFLIKSGYFDDKSHY